MEKNTGTEGKRGGKGRTAEECAAYPQQLLQSARGAPRMAGAGGCLWGGGRQGGCEDLSLHRVGQLLKGPKSHEDADTGSKGTGGVSRVAVGRC